MGIQHRRFHRHFLYLPTWEYNADISCTSHHGNTKRRRQEVVPPIMGIQHGPGGEHCNDGVIRHLPRGGVAYPAVYGPSNVSARDTQRSAHSGRSPGTRRSAHQWTGTPGPPSPRLCCMRIAPPDPTAVRGRTEQSLGCFVREQSRIAERREATDSNRYRRYNR